MLITPKKNPTKKTVTFRIDPFLLDKFKRECKKNGLIQVTIIENAMKKALEEIKEMEEKLK